MIPKIFLAGLCACLTLAPLSASANGGSDCLTKLSVVNAPSFKNLRRVELSLRSGASSEGSDVQAFVRADGNPATLVVTRYGETGKKVALYELFDGNPKQFSARISEYRYTRPIYAGPAEVATVRTLTFRVCSGLRVNGIGADDISAETVAEANRDVGEVISELLRSKRK